MAPLNGLAIVRTSGGASVAGAKGDVANGSTKLYDVISDVMMKLSSMAESGTTNDPLTGPAKGAGEVVVKV
jgi:hypothetical protein